jgi:hypothetical protein
MIPSKRSAQESKEEKREVFDNNVIVPLPSEILNNTLSLFSTPEEKAILFSASPQFFGLSRYKRSHNTMVTELLELTLNPEEKNIETAKSMIKKNYRLLLEKTLHHVPWSSKLITMSPIQCAALTGDIFLVKDYLTLLPVDQRHEAGMQLKAVFDRPDYLSPYQSYIDSCTEFQQLLEELYNPYNREFNYTGPRPEIDELNRQWVTIIGGAQYKLPVYGLQEICSHHIETEKTGFFSSSKFSRPPNRTCQLKGGQLLNINSLGKTCALLRTVDATTSSDLAPIFGRGGINADSAILINNNHERDLPQFCKMRKNELGNIIKELLPHVSDMGNKNATGLYGMWESMIDVLERFVPG